MTESISATFIVILITGTSIMFLIRSNLWVKYISLLLFWLKSILLIYLYDNSNIYVFPDSYQYIYVLNDISKGNTYDFNSVANSAQTLHVGFYYLYTFIYEAFGNDFAILLVNTLLTSVSAILFYKVFAARFGDKIALITFVTFSLSTNMLIFGSFILKDPLVIFLTALSLYLYLNKGKTFLAMLLALFLVTVRIYAGVGLIVGILVDYMIFSKLSKKRKTLTILGLSLLTIILLNSPISQSYLGISTRFFSDISFFDAAIASTVSIVHFFLAPLPWNLIDTQGVYGFLITDSILMLLFSFALVFFVVKWFKFSHLRRSFYVFMVPVLVHALALGVEYGGDSTRQRSGIFVFLILTFVIGVFYEGESSQQIKNHPSNGVTRGRIKKRAPISETIGHNVTQAPNDSRLPPKGRGAATA